MEIVGAGEGEEGRPVRSGGDRRSGDEGTRARGFRAGRHGGIEQVVGAEEGRREGHHRRRVGSGELVDAEASVPVDADRLHVPHRIADLDGGAEEAAVAGVEFLTVRLGCRGRRAEGGNGDGVDREGIDQRHIFYARHRVAGCVDRQKVRGRAVIQDARGDEVLRWQNGVETGVDVGNVEGEDGRAEVNVEGQEPPGLSKSEAHRIRVGAKVGPACLPCCAGRVGRSRDVQAPQAVRRIVRQCDDHVGRAVRLVGDAHTIKGLCHPLLQGAEQAGGPQGGECVICAVGGVRLVEDEIAFVGNHDPVRRADRDIDRRRGRARRADVGRAQGAGERQRGGPGGARGDAEAGFEVRPRGDERPLDDGGGGLEVACPAVGNAHLRAGRTRQRRNSYRHQQPAGPLAKGPDFHGCVTPRRELRGRTLVYSDGGRQPHPCGGRGISFRL